MKHNLTAKKDISRRAFIIAALVIICVKLMLASQQQVFIIPDGAPIDDNLMYNMAVSITKGEWLGDYNWLTLSKYCFFPVYLALVHTLHIPYLLAGQLLQLLSCAFAVWAFAPVLKNRIWRLILFAALLFNPAVNSAEVQLRVYRDSITAQLALIFFAGFIGAALRYKKSAKSTLPFLILGGFGLAASYLNREDGIWLLPFAVCASITVCVYLIIEKKPAKCLLQLVPYAVLLAGIIAVCSMNSAYYGRFILSDYTSSEFKDACGAMMRVSEKTQSIDKVPVTLAARRIIAENIPEFAGVEARLESAEELNGKGELETLEYPAGGFFWALRESVYELGFASSAAQAQQYYQMLADRINALCDEGVIDGGRRQSGSTMPLRAEYILPSIQEAFINMGRALTFAEAQPYEDDLSIATPEALEEYQRFLNDSANYAAMPNTDRPYYSNLAHMAYNAMDIIKGVMAAALCAGFALALFWQVKSAVFMLKNKSADALLLWIILLGLLLCALLRCGIIAFMFVSSFNRGVPHIMYLCTVHPLLIMYACIGASQLLKAPRGGKAAA